nr:MAG TPA: hypothetical protein [Caudoviricetes sp.]
MICSQSGRTMSIRIRNWHRRRTLTGSNAKTDECAYTANEISTKGKLGQRKIPPSRVTGWDAWLNDNSRCWRILQSIFDVLIHGHLMRCCINEQLFMKVRGKADIEAAFECNFGFLSFCLAGFQIIIDGTVKIVQKFLGTFAFVRNQGTNPHDLTIKNAIFFGKLNASDIAFVLNSVIHMRPSCSKISISCLI